jgi:hypothetical protein
VTALHIHATFSAMLDAGQSSVYIDRLFTGDFLGTKSDIASGELRHDEFRTYENIQGDYYIAPRFLHRIAMHVTKNYLAAKLKGVKVPLILGIWGASAGTPLPHISRVHPDNHWFVWIIC